MIDNQAIGLAPDVCPKPPTARVNSSRLICNILFAFSRSRYYNEWLHNQPLPVLFVDSYFNYLTTMVGVTISRRNTLYCNPGQVCPLSRYSLALTYVACFEMEEEQLYSFRERGDRDQARASLWKTPGFPPKIRLPSTANTIPVPEPRWLPGFQPYSRQYHLMGMRSVTDGGPLFSLLLILCSNNSLGIVFTIYLSMPVST